VLVKDIMMRKVSVIEPGARLALAACMMRDQDVGCLPVIEGGRLVGMITDRDIVVRGVAEGLNPHRAMVREAMSANAIACSAQHTVEQARALMAANLIKHLPVLDEGERLVGLVALQDITGQFAKCKPHEVTFYKRLVSSSGPPPERRDRQSVPVACDQEGRRGNRPPLPSSSRTAVWPAGARSPMAMSSSKVTEAARRPPAAGT
jgi:CBS domain-containing protein